MLPGTWQDLLRRKILSTQAPQEIYKSRSAKCELTIKKSFFPTQKQLIISERQKTGFQGYQMKKNMHAGNVYRNKRG